MDKSETSYQNPTLTHSFWSSTYISVAWFSANIGLSQDIYLYHFRCPMLYSSCIGLVSAKNISMPLLLKKNLTCRSSWLLLSLLWLSKGPFPPPFPVCPSPPFPGSPPPISGHSVGSFALWTVPYSIFWNEDGFISLLFSYEERSNQRTLEYPLGSFFRK